MNFIDAHITMHNFIDVVTDYLNPDAYLFLPKSKIKESIPDIYDSFLIFIGHSLLFGTRTIEDLKRCMSLTRYIDYIVDDNIYETAIIDNKLIYSQNKLSSIFQKKNIDEAKKRQSVFTKITIDIMDNRQKKLEAFDKSVYLIEERKIEIAKKLKDSFSHRDMIEYIDYIYSFTNVNINKEEDYFYFTTFDVMRKDIHNGSKFYEHYKDYIMHAN